MVAGDIRLAVNRWMALTATYSPAFVGVERVLFSLGRKPLRDAAHLPRIAVENIEPAGYSRRDIGGKKLCDVNHILEVLAALQTLRHARQQFADRPVGVALFFQTLSHQSILTKNADRLRHVANFVDLVKVGRLNRIILGGQAIHHVAQTHHRSQHAAF
ncbi:hypothetical protein D3C78_1254950 [compost metagenome]